MVDESGFVRVWNINTGTFRLEMVLLLPVASSLPVSRRQHASALHDDQS